jgi:antitoxin HicB
VKVLNYRVRLKKEIEGGYTVTVPALPGCVTYGETVDDSLSMVKEAIEGYLESLKAHGEEIPSDDNLLEYNLTINTNE